MRDIIGRSESIRERTAKQGQKLISPYTDRYRSWLRRHSRIESILNPGKDDDAINRLSLSTYDSCRELLKGPQSDQAILDFQIAHVAKHWLDSYVSRQQIIWSTHSGSPVTIALLGSSPRGETQKIAIAEAGVPKVIVLAPPDAEHKEPVHPTILVVPRANYGVWDIIRDHKPPADLRFEPGKRGIMDFISEFADLKEAQHFKNLVSGVLQQHPTTASPVR